MDSQIISLNEELQDMREKYNELRNGNASKNHLNDDTPMCERHEANYIQSEDYQNQNSYDLFSHQSFHDPNDSEKSLTELNNDVRNDLEDFKRCIHSMRIVHWKLYDSDDRKTTGVLPNKKSKPINQELQSKTDFEKLMTKFLDGQRVLNIKIDEWEKSQNISSEQTNWTEPQPPPQAQTGQVNVVFTGNGKSDDSPKTQKDSPHAIIVKIKKDKPIKTSKRDYHVVKTNEYPFRNEATGVSIPSLLMCICGFVAFSGAMTAVRLIYRQSRMIRGEINPYEIMYLQHLLLVLRSPKYPKSKKNVLGEEEVLCQP
ncbi:hypothetical protein Tco_0545394 [Tanacetum coccineum]